MRKILGLKTYLILTIGISIPFSLLLLNKDNTLEKLLLFVVGLFLITFFSVFIVIKEDTLVVYNHFFKKRTIPKKALLKVMIIEHIGRGALHDLVFINQDNTSIKYKMLERTSAIPNYGTELELDGILFEHNIFPIKG